MHVRFPSELGENFILFRILLVLFFFNSIVLAYNYGILSYNPLSKHKHFISPDLA